MPDLLYVPGSNLPEQLLHHAILYRDGICTLIPDKSSQHLPNKLRKVADAGLYRQLPARQVWQNDSVRSAAWAACWQAIAAADERAIRTSTRERQNYLSMNVRLLVGDLITRYGKSTPELKRLLPRRGFDPDAWTSAMCEVFDELWRAHCSPPERDSDWSEYVAAMPDMQAKLLAGTAYGLAAEASIRAAERLVVPCFAPEMGRIVEDFAMQASGDHLLLQVDVGRLLPDPLPNVDTAMLIDFRRRYGDERRQLINAVERLIEQLAQTYEDPAHIERSVRRDLEEALDNMRKAGRDVLRGWTRRIVSVATAAGATAATTALAGGPALFVATTSALAGVAVNKTSDPIPHGRRDAKYDGYRYLYRIRAALDAGS